LTMIPVEQKRGQYSGISIRGDVRAVVAAMARQMQEISLSGLSIPILDSRQLVALDEYRLREGVSTDVS
jgi:hypothetical protein